MRTAPDIDTATLVDEIRTLMSEQILSGQSEDLSPTTPLLELGILGSFELLKLVAELNAAYAIGLRPEEIAGQDFVDVNAIAGMVAGRRPVRRNRPLTSPASDSAVVFEASSCAQVFVLFTGRGRDMGLNNAEFFRLAGLESRNVIVFHDAQENSYRAGVSAALPTPAAVCEWVAQWVAQRPWVEEIYCVGFSSGGPMAMLAGHVLGARTVWAFAPRTAQGNLPLEMMQRFDAFLTRVTGKSTAQLLANMTEADREKIDAEVTPALIESYYEALLDPDQILNPAHLGEIVSALSQGNGVTEHRVYYVERDACDSRVVEALSACPGVVPIVVEPSDAPPDPWPFSRWVPPIRWVYRDHMIIDLLRDRGELATVFPPFRQATASAASGAS